MKIACRFILLLVMAVAACDSGKGADSLFGRSPHTGGTVSPCTRCHAASNSPGLDPLLTGGTGTAGKHVKHVTERGIDCEVCHKGYMSNPNHINGTIDTGSSVATAVSFSVTGPSGAWVNAAGQRTGNCSGVACHGAAVMEWYGTGGWTLPACTECHSSVFSTDLDPVATNGAPPAGRHAKHVSSRGIGCERCHFAYPAKVTHMNGRLDSADAQAALVSFNITGPSGSWTKEAPQTGQCSAVACHGPDTVEWYGTGTWTLPSSCLTCHAASFSSALDPTLTNGNGLAGKHGRHVSSIGFSCTKCHLGYTSSVSHASGVMDTQDAATRLVVFDSTNPSGVWAGDTGPETGACSSLFCHGTETPEWYGLAGVTQPATCAVCHGSPLGTRRQVMGANGDFGANPNIVSHHVTAGPGSDPGTDQCLVCHEMSQHMAGTVRLKNADTTAAVAYDPANPSSLEPFCLSCHDSTGALATFRSGGMPTAPFIDGSVMGRAPNRASVEILANWDKTFGHRRQGLTCIGNGGLNTGCHANGHGSPHVGLLALNLILPVTKANSFAAADEPDYGLCFSCHAASPRVTKEVIFGMQRGGRYDLEAQNSRPPVIPPYFIPAIQTGFRDHNLNRASGNIYDDPTFFGGFQNLHLFHVQIGPGAWNYRDSIPSSVHCLSCHSIHGSNTPFGWVHDEMLFSHFTGVGTDAYGMIGVALNQLGAYPTSCSFNCHPILGVTHSWFEPSGE